MPSLQRSATCRRNPDRLGVDAVRGGSERPSICREHAGLGWRVIPRKKLRRSTGVLAIPLPCKPPQVLLVRDAAGRVARVRPTGNPATNSWTIDLIQPLVSA